MRPTSLGTAGMLGALLGLICTLSTGCRTARPPSSVSQPTPSSGLPQGASLLATGGVVALSPDHSQAITSDAQGRLGVWSLWSGERVTLGLQVEGGNKPSAHWSPIQWSRNSACLALLAPRGTVKHASGRPWVFDMGPQVGPPVDPHIARTYVYNVRQTAADPVARFDQGGLPVAWAPDNRTLCFEVDALDDPGPFIWDGSQHPPRRLFDRPEQAVPRSQVLNTGEERSIPQFRKPDVLAKNPNSGLNPKLWSPDGKYMAGLVAVWVDLRTTSNDQIWDYGLKYPVLLDLETRRVTLVGEQQVVRLIGFAGSGKRLYCLFGGNTQLGASDHGGVPGYLALHAKPVLHWIRLPGYRRVVGRGSDKLADPGRDRVFYRSPDGFVVEDAAPAISSDERLLALWETLTRMGPQGIEPLAVRLVTWNLGGSPQPMGTVEVRADSQPALFRMLQFPVQSSFTPDGRRLAVLFLSGAVLEYTVPQERGVRRPGEPERSSDE